jgi:hypothetical protein
MDNEKVRVLRDDVVFVIILDPDGGKIYLQQKDGTYHREKDQFSYCFIGTGIIPENREDAFSALERKLRIEMPNAQRNITNEMRFWKTFRLTRTKSANGQYNCHVFVRIMENEYRMIDLVEAIRGSGKKRATETYISLARFKQIPKDEFMDSLGVVAEAFLEEIKTGSAHLWADTQKKK